MRCKAQGEPGDEGSQQVQAAVQSFTEQRGAAAEHRHRDLGRHQKRVGNDTDQRGPLGSRKEHVSLKEASAELGNPKISFTLS